MVDHPVAHYIAAPNQREAGLKLHLVPGLCFSLPTQLGKRLISQDFGTLAGSPFNGNLKPAECLLFGRGCWVGRGVHVHVPGLGEVTILPDCQGAFTVVPIKSDSYRPFKLKRLSKADIIICVRHGLSPVGIPVLRGHSFRSAEEGLRRQPPSNLFPCSQ
jgi:hypothetical protein